MKRFLALLCLATIISLSCKHENSANTEIAILESLRLDLVQNLDDINSNIASLEISKRANELVIKNMEENIPYHDSLDVYFANLYPYLVFSPNETTFYHLKMAGMTSISNDSIRASISDLYGVQYGIYKDYERIYFVEHYTNYIKPMFIENFESFKFYRSFKPRNYIQFIKDPTNKRVITYTRDAIETFIFMQVGLKEEAQKLLSAIEEELENK